MRASRSVTPGPTAATTPHGSCPAITGPVLAGVLAYVATKRSAVLGFWMLPAGLVLLAEDVPPPDYAAPSSPRGSECREFS